MTKADKPRRRPSKKTEALEIRLSPEEKSAFLDACRKMGRSASAVIRDAMRAYANFGPMARLPGSPIMIISAFAGAALGSVALYLFVQQPEAEEERFYGVAEFNLLDRNGDNRLMLEEVLLAAGTSQENLTRRFEAGRAPTYGDLTGLRGGVFASISRNPPLDPFRFAYAPETISDDCWAGVEAIHRQKMESNFRFWDGDQDGTVLVAEYSRVRLASYRAEFEGYDLSGDGAISRQEWLELAGPALGNSLRAAGPALPLSLIDLPALCAAEAQLPPYEYWSPQRDSPPDRVDPGRLAEMHEYRDLTLDGDITFEEFLALKGR
jgi:hypothetical protein